MRFDTEGSKETFDPQDQHALRALGQRKGDDMQPYLETIRERPVWQPIPEEAKAHLSQPLPAEPQGPEWAHQDFPEQVLPHPMGNVRPSVWSWMISTGTPGITPCLQSATTVQ